MTENGFDLSGIDVGRYLDSVRDTSLGDYATNISFRLAKGLKKNPRELAQELEILFSNAIQTNSLGSLVLSIKETNGYVNFRLNTGNLVELVTSTILQKGTNYARLPKYANTTIMVEHTSANPTKPLHIGHLRNMIVGDTLARMYSALGCKTKVLNYIDDMGRQMASLIVGFLKKIHLHVPRPPGMKFDVWLGLIYAEVEKRASEQPEIKSQIDQTLENTKKDKKLFRFNREIAQQCVYSNLETAMNLNVTYDALIWESDIALGGIWEKTFGILEAHPEHFGWETEGPNTGAFVARFRNLAEFRKMTNPDKVIVRSNKVPTYVAHDIGFQFWKFGMISEARLHFYPLFVQNVQGNLRTLVSSNYRKLPQAEALDLSGADRVINVIGAEQTYLQDVIRHVFRLLGEEEKATNSIHLSYKHVTLPDQRFSGRSGNWFEEESWGDIVLERTVLATYQSTRERRAGDLKEDELRSIAQKLGVGALRYWLLKFSLEKNIVFDYSAVTNLVGETAPFVVYTAVRTLRILEKTPLLDTKPDYSKCTSEHEKRLAMVLAEFPEALLKATESNEPHEMALFAYNLSVLFNSFYENCPVNDPANPSLSMARRFFIQAYYAVLSFLLNAILGIEIPSRM
ncbi:MAG TPA: arginine--tRNA ligase [Candidatus Hodarchaeales archaeon]|nr:arginine--tRNA ligase [Candidatus Hodarchaeales archaeon]